MRIGEFAKICGTKISVLRHYDRQNVLKPDYIDSFTGYRYYSKEQIAIFFRISALKKAGFSLSDISGILSEIKTDKDILALFDRKKQELSQTLLNLEEAKKMIMEGEVSFMNNEASHHNVIFLEIEDGESSHYRAKSGKIDPKDFHTVCDYMESVIAAQDYQRITNYMTYGEPDSKLIEVVCEVVKLNAEMMPLKEKFDLPFEDDPSVVGKWEVLGEYPVKTDFYSEKFVDNSWFGGIVKAIYFLPKGKGYWCYQGWTKGFLFLETGDSTSVNSYEIEEQNGARYMFVNHKSYNYCRGGQPTVIVLRQADNREYTSMEIFSPKMASDSRIFENLFSTNGIRQPAHMPPFIPDERVIGKWKSVDFCLDKDEWMPQKDVLGKKEWYFKEIEFMGNGSCTSIYGNETISGDDRQVWTKGFVLRKWNQTACAYEIRRIDGIDYLIIEWKSGDYRWGGLDTDYYVFVRK